MSECEFIADVIVRNGNGKGWRRIADVQCMGGADHTDEHEFLAGSAHTFGASFEKGRWVSR